MFAGIQVNLFGFLGVVSGLPIGTAQAIFANISVQSSIEKIKMVMSIKNFPKEDIDDVNRCLIHIKAMNNARNDIVHYGIEGDGPESHLNVSEFMVSNRFSALTPDKMTRFVVSGSILRDMTEDIGQILSIFTILSMRYQGMPIETTVDEIREGWRWKRQDALL